MGKLIKVFLWLLMSKSAISLIYEICKASKDGKITKEEFEGLTFKLGQLIKEIV
jgi:hypothetical protein